MTLVEEIEIRAKLPEPRIRIEIREAAGVRVSRLARELDVAPVTVKRWESGTYTPRGAQLAAYADLLAEMQAATK